MTETHDTAPARDSDAEPTEHELRALAASLHITVPPGRPCPSSAAAGTTTSPTTSSPS
ncbi:hypothetical protein ID875_21110 [Streptomyces globisporus]|uniref:Uncharacterized protein n=1 Tax=Streptomyces globisporus TaxID=1908 RepID=A0A927BNI4_STRGL|nr:hypothetical protein [Streptomyces globisporus]